MRKKAPFVCALVLFAAGTVAALDRPVEVYASAVTGPAITLVLSNPEGTAQTVRAQVAVLVAGGGEEILTSANVVVGPGGTSTVTLTASSAIVAIGDDPETILPL